jgi:hypothetical protein
MLGDQDRHVEARRQGTQKGGDGMKAAGGAAKRQAIERTLGSIAQGECGGRACGILRFLDTPDPLQALNQRSGKGGGRLACARLGEGIGCAQRQSSDARLRPFLAGGGDDQDAGAGCEDRPKHLEAADTGHLKIEEHDIRRLGSQRGKRFFAAAGAARHFERPVRRQHTGEHRTSYGRVIYDKETERPVGKGWSHRGRRGGGTHAKPTICSLSSRVSRSNGFMTYSSAPASIAAWMCAASFSVVQKTTFG